LLAKNYFMAQKEQPLYPKVSPIYNKIMQLAIAIVMIVVVMNLWIFSYDNNQQAIKDNFYFVGDQYISQMASSIKFILNKDKVASQAYIDEMSQQKWVKDISFYDETGLLVMSSSDQISLNDLYGISSYKIDKSEKYTPFVQEVRNENTLIGYLRLTIENNGLTHHVIQASEQHHHLMRLMMILAGVIGFFLTRGLNRFSRRGFRLVK